MDELREQILTEGIEQFRSSGLKFTMQEIAGSLHISKKTMYKYFTSKEELLLALLDEGYRKIHSEKKKVIESDLPLEERIARVMIAMPEQYSMLEFSQLDGLREKYPAVAEALQQHLLNDWEPTIALLNEGIDAGVIRDINISVLKVMVTSSIQAFTSTHELADQGITYQEALQIMMDIIMRGIRRDKHDQTE